MNKYIFVLLVFLFSCSVDPLEQDIIERLETIEGVRYDLNTKVLRVQQMEVITAADSIGFLEDVINRAEKHIDSTYQLWKQVDPDKDIEEIRSIFIPDMVDNKLSEYKSNSDSVLLIPYRVVARQKVNGISREFEQVVYLK